MRNISQFYTREAANEGIELPLSLPSGEESGFSIKIRGSDSDAFKMAEAAERRGLAKLDKVTDEEEISKLIGEQRLKLLASLVISWNLTDDDGEPYPCTLENILDLLKEAPRIADQIDRLSTRNSLFSISSSCGQSKNSEAKKDQPEQEAPKSST